MLFVQKGENCSKESCILTKSIQNDIISCNCKRYARTMLVANRTRYANTLAESHGSQGRVSVYKH